AARPAAIGESEGEADALAAARIELDVGLPPDGVDPPVARRDAGEAGLQRAHRHLGAPVKALLVASLAAGEANLPADVADLGIPEAGDEAAQGVRAPVAVRVREGEDVARRISHRAVER